MKNIYLRKNNQLMRLSGFLLLSSVLMPVQAIAGNNCSKYAIIHHDAAGSITGQFDTSKRVISVPLSCLCRKGFRIKESPIQVTSNVHNVTYFWSQMHIHPKKASSGKFSVKYDCVKALGPRV